ncbi:hypothetical protein [Rhizobium sp. 60-20]|uniref:hypothetical protein n=1 Tax=Rhizobium sp. 60-20 TaxID=1895819 RepID=UPI00092CC66A|nr:hypothetical protein [Rhizobium sp. 60-20]OJY66407.1 MAG: hypothetical protein BGP09_31240 [Rhizobium sp. 60-20]
MTRCDFRSHRECDCPAGKCQQQVSQPAPVITFTAKEQFFAMAMLTLFMTIISFAVLSRVDHVIKVQDLDRQEQITWRK